MSDDVRARPADQALPASPPEPVPVSALSGNDPSRVRNWLVAMTRQGEDQVWRGAERALKRLDELEAALAPFASYTRAMDAYAALHRGQHLSDSKVLAYSQTEMGTCGALVVGHFRDAAHVMDGMALPGWGGMYRSAIRDSDTRRMAETGTGSVRSTGSAGRQASPGNSPHPSTDKTGDGV